MTRSEFDDIRAHIGAGAQHAADLLEIASELLDDLEQARVREATLRSYYLSLLTAARATVAASNAGDPAPMTFLLHELAKHGQLPADDAEAQRILSDAKTAQSLIPRIDDEPPARRPRPGSRARSCVGLSRTLPR
ncbi:hypothetical protein [Microtetraspora sp. NBRC 16547]|uniref:hypothetical protein n=1 Tax=Microtetraspora sp. NBRC 16547 TaxID=3030993 RepID=UPI0024A27291|nr:hypothetical protein [Microtetraspora sp. NBRC 16547]GLW97808.1 hypothetical protein Misp02_18950 [Microtetraspora sp. NBRC 16547]